MKRTRLSSDDLSDAESAGVAASGRKLSEIVTHYLSLENRARVKGIDLDMALSLVDAHYRSEIKTISVLNACDEFVATRSGGSQITKIHDESSLRLLKKSDPNKLVHTFTVGDIEKIIACQPRRRHPLVESPPRRQRCVPLDGRAWTQPWPNRLIDPRHHSSTCSQPLGTQRFYRTYPRAHRHAKIRSLSLAPTP